MPDAHSADATNRAWFSASRTSTDQEFHDDGRMKDSPYRDRVVDVMEELYKFTLLTRDLREFLVDRYSERREAAGKAALDPNSPKHRLRDGGL